VTKFVFWFLVVLGIINSMALLYAAVDGFGINGFVWFVSAPIALYLAGFRLVRKEVPQTVKSARRCTECGRLESATGKRCLFTADKKHRFITIKF